MVNYEPDVSQLLALYQQLEDDVIADMVRRILKMGFVSETTAYQAELLQTAGLLYEDILQLIANRTDASVAQVRALFEDAGVQTVEIDNKSHEAAGEAPVDIRQDPGMKQVLEAGYRKTLGTMRNLVSTTANATQTEFIQTCDRAYMQMSSGAFSYQEAIRSAVRQLAVAKQHAEDAGCKYMELTAHGGARPEHAKWQGQLVVIQGERTKAYIDGLKVFTLREIGYGDGSGFKGWNCRHNWHPYYPGLSTPNYTPEQIKQLDAKTIAYNGEKYTEYEVSQMQRAGERKVRALKRRTLAAQEAVKSAPDKETKAVLQADYAANAVKLKESEKQLKTFCSQTGQRRDTFREQVDGFGRSASQKAVHAASEKKRLTIDWDSGKIDTEVFRKSIQKGYVKTKVEKNKQIKHTYNKQWKNQVKQAVQSFSDPDPKKRQTPRSVLRKDIDPQEIVDKYGGTGKMESSSKGDCVNEFITLPFVVGKTFEKKKGKYVDTHTVQIKYSAKGVHIFPTYSE